VVAKKISVVTESGDSVEARWREDDGVIFVSGTRIGTTKTVKDAIATVEVYAGKLKGSRVKRVDIS